MFSQSFAGSDGFLDGLFGNRSFRQSFSSDAVSKRFGDGHFRLSYLMSRSSGAF